MHACVCIFVSVCMCAMRTCERTYIHVLCVDVCMCVLACLTVVCLHVCPGMCIYTCTCACVYAITEMGAQTYNRGVHVCI